MPDPIDTQLVVLGAGPGGYAAAFLAADKGQKVTLIDATPRPGGTCLHVGCIPSKSVLHTAKLILDARDAKEFGLTFDAPKIDINGVRGHWQKVVDTLSKNLVKLCEARKIRYVNGRGRFVDPNTIEVEGVGQVRFETCIIATGSSPARPGALGVEQSVGHGFDRGPETRGYSEASPRHRRRLHRPRNGHRLRRPRQQGDRRRNDGRPAARCRPRSRRAAGEAAREAVRQDPAKHRRHETGRGQRRHQGLPQGRESRGPAPVFERVLVSVGRRPNSRDLGLDKAGVNVDEKGFVPVDAQRRTNVPHIFAIGDVAGEPMLAHKATYEGRVAAEVIAGEKSAYDVRAVPAVVFTDPEIAWCGLTELDAKKEGREVKRVRFPWAGSGRAMTLGRTEGMTKLLVDPETDRILGVGIVGVEAGNLIGEAMLALEMAASARDLGLTMHAHPTLSETLMEAAETSHGFPTHGLPRKG